ncbi:hypothetical protein J5N97_007784 [Dioscorea zingiberensis]|uniref:Protein TIFY n=1 Tax=Dioscorea zingiberensis TaxID=325984 RepID=A0A9D5DCI6_9LILI|nr:hypothetical protein J5N97_007784 [Dioscorea zingiberensis]
MNGGDLPDLDLCLGSGVSCVSSEPSSSGACIKGIRRNLDLQQITIFYGGQVCVSDVTDLQAKAIICMAKGSSGVTMDQEKQEQQMEPCSSNSRSPPVSPHAVAPQQQLHNPELSMKRSLQRFLQKRKTRIDSSSPYAAHKHSLLSLRSS